MKAAVYARVSVKHQNRKDLSIEAQNTLCEKYLRQKKDIREPEIEFFSDLGYSGRRFDRPALLRLQEKAKNGEIQCVVVKDLSRLGRDYRRTGELAEKFFPSYGVRLLSVSEGYDSASLCGSSAAAGLYHLLNEWYARDIGRKVSMVKKEKKAAGNYLGSVAPYGYRIVKKEGIRLLEPDESFSILAAIYAMRERGSSSSEIVQWLWMHGVNPPSVYRRCGEIAQAQGQAPRWEGGTVRRVLARCAQMPEFLHFNYKE